AALARGLTLAELEREYIERVLASEGGNKTRAAARLGLDRKTLYRKLEEYARADGGGVAPAGEDEGASQNIPSQSVPVSGPAGPRGRAGAGPREPAAGRGPEWVDGRKGRRFEEGAVLAETRLDRVPAPAEIDVRHRVRVDSAWQQHG